MRFQSIIIYESFKKCLKNDYYNGKISLKTLNNGRCAKK